MDNATMANESNSFTRIQTVEFKIIPISSNRLWIPTSENKIYNYDDI